MLEERFTSKYIEDDNGCWLWQRGLTHDGYPRYAYDGRTRYAHVYSYIETFGPIPDGLELDHLCRVRQCVNPDHLEAVTHQTNVLRGETLPAAGAAKKQCQFGHPLDGMNNLGKRFCRTCHRERERRRYSSRRSMQAA